MRPNENGHVSVSSSTNSVSFGEFDSNKNINGRGICIDRYQINIGYFKNGQDAPGKYTVLVQGKANFRVGERYLNETGVLKDRSTLYKAYVQGEWLAIR